MYVNDSFVEIINVQNPMHTEKQLVSGFTARESL